MDTDDLLVRAHQPRVTAQVSPSCHLWQSGGSTGRYLPAGAAPPCSMVAADLVGYLPLALLSTLESQPLAKDTIPNDFRHCNILLSAVYNALTIVIQPKLVVLPVFQQTMLAMHGSDEYRNALSLASKNSRD